MTPAPVRPVRVAVIGAGAVGATFAYALVLSGLASEIVLVDSNVEILRRLLPQVVRHAPTRSSGSPPTQWTS